MRADRLLSLLWILKREGRPVSARRLADELEVSRRTVLRDVEALSASGVPVYCERGRAGGIALLPGFRTDVSGLTPQEAFALFATASMGSAAALGMADVARSALRKIAASLPANAGRQNWAPSTAVLIDPRGWFPGQLHPWLTQCRDAVVAGTVVEFGYRSASSGWRRRIRTPARGLVCAATTWYLVGETGTAYGDHTAYGEGSRAEAGDRFRFYRLDRMDAFEGTDETAPPRDIDVERVWLRARERFASRFTPLVARLEVRAPELATLQGLAGVEVLGPVDGRPGWTSVLARFGDRSHATEVLPRLVPGLRVQSPPELVDALRELAAELVAACAVEPVEPT